MSRTIDVSFEREGFAAEFGGENKTFTLSFSYSPSPAIVHWNDVVDKPSEQNPYPFAIVAFTGDYDHLYNKPGILTNNEIDQILIV